MEHMRRLPDVLGHVDDIEYHRDVDAVGGGAREVELRAVVLTRARYRAALAAAPEHWGRKDDRKHNALFTLRGVTPQRVVAQLPHPREDIETFAAGPGVIFWSISRQHQTRTTWMKLAAAPVYQDVTVRNHRTVFRLRELLDEL